ncbi:MAG: hypothetical protein ACR2JX_01100 [Mycobacteriales bacterium]
MPHKQHTLDGPLAHPVDRRANAARLRATLALLPAPTWFSCHAEAIDKLRVTVPQVLAGAARREPDDALRGCTMAREGLREVAKLLQAAWAKLDAYSRAQGFGGVDARATTAPMPTSSPVPTPPKAHTLADIATFVQRCLPLLDPTMLRGCADRLGRARSDLAALGAPWNATIPAGAGYELTAATTLLGQAQQGLIAAAERLTFGHESLRRYLIVVLGSARGSESRRRKLSSRAGSARVSKQLRRAKPPTSACTPMTTSI